jgi:putative DNA methylase
VQWENTNNEAVLERAREEIREELARDLCELNENHPQAAELFNPDKLPAFHDPFAGGGACRWRRSGWGWRATPATSTRWP